MPPVSKSFEYDGKHVCIVYQYVAGVSAGDIWYHQWGLNVMTYLGEGFLALGLKTKFVDIESFVNDASAALNGVDYSVNLICGNIDISYWGLVPSMSAWYGVIPLPNRTEVILVGERKDTANMVAERVGLKCPIWSMSLAKLPETSKYVVSKPRDFGSSVGIVIDTKERLSERGGDSCVTIFQEFIEGVDITVPVLYDARNNCHIFGHAVAFVPISGNYSWVLDDKAKGVNRIGQKLTDIRKVYYEPPLYIKDRVRELISHLGGTSVARVDFRVALKPGQEVHSASPDDYYFIEINPVPTMNLTSDFVGGIQSSIDSHKGDLFSYYEYISKRRSGLRGSAALVAYSMLKFGDITSTENGRSGRVQSDE